MKKLLFTACLLTISYFAFAQPRIGLMTAASFSAGRVNYDADTISNNGSTLLFKFGLECDFMITDNYAFSTGILYSPERLSLKSEGPSGERVEEYRVQYIQLPATLKLFTNEIQPDLKVYFQLGFLGEILVHGEPIDNDSYLIDDFKFYDFSFVGGAGVEYGAGINTVLYGGFFYEHGLVNVVHRTTDLTPHKIEARMSSYNIKVGLKF